MSRQRHYLRLISACSLLLSVCSVATHVRADVHRTGEWPSDDDERVTLNFEGSRSQALRELASKAGWSIIDSPGSQGHGSTAMSGASESVNLYVTDQPAVKVLELLLKDGDYDVRRDGKLLSISKSKPKPSEPAGTSDAPPSSAQTLGASKPAAPGATATDDRMKSHDARDRSVFGRSATIGRDEVVKNLTVMGGSADLHGLVEEDVLVLGGSLSIHKGAHVRGDVSVLGGSVELHDGARVDGDLSAAGGDIERASGAIVKGDEVALLDDDSADDDKPAKESNGDSDQAEDDESWSFVASMRKLGGALSRAALLYGFGCVLLAAAGRHMKLMQAELEERPVRALGLGLATLVGGAMALVALIVTIIGIPVAILAVLVGALGVYAGMCAVFLEVGALMLEERTPNPYAHLALGCLIYLIFSALPIIGWIATGAAGVFGVGLLVSALVTTLFGHSQSAPKLT